MARALTHKKVSKQKTRKLAHPAKKAKPKTGSKPVRRNVSTKARPSSRKAKAVTRAKKGTLSSAQHSIEKESKNMQADSRKPAVKTGATSAPNATVHLLRQTKTTAAALALLEKAIELLYKKEFKKARLELKTLLETYPGEMEILARARSYIQICEREEANQKRPPVTTDQLYTLGILEHNRANYDKAISYFLQSLEIHPNADYIYYSVAASLAMKGDLAESMENLRRAITLNEDSRIYAKNDSDFSALQSQREFAELVGLGLPAATESES
jgi:tetratricopeptide (TPR) repeat protein